MPVAPTTVNYMPWWTLILLSLCHGILSQGLKGKTDRNYINKLGCSHDRHYLRTVSSWDVEEFVLGAGEMAQRLRALTALSKVLSSIPSNYIVAHSHL